MARPARGGKVGTLLLGVILSLLTATPVQAEPPALTAVVRLQARVSMESLAREVQDPGSPRYQVYFSPGEIKALAGPSDADYQDTLTQLRANGLDVVSESPTHLWVSVEGPASAYEKIFAISLTSLRQGEYRPPYVSSLVRLVVGVTGLDDTHRAHPYALHPADLPPAEQEKFQGIPQARIKSAYGFDPIYQSGITGLGQDIAIATFNSFMMSDVNRFFADSKLPARPHVDVIEFNGMPSYLWDTAGETALDIEFAGLIAPGANIHVFTSATNDDTGEAQMFTAILDDARSHVVSFSYGDCEGKGHVSTNFMQEMSVVFARAVAQGVNIFVSSGDNGSDSCGDGTLSAEFPSTDPHVISVGGTTFHDGPERHETAWSCALDGSQSDCSGGGISSFFTQPDFQKFLAPSFSKRAYPDVSFNADPTTGEAAFITDMEHPDGAYVVVGGTSMAVPHWAGLMALVNEARGRQSKKPLGYINPYLYGSSAAERAKIFVDITDGSNGVYRAGPGWDAVTGFGSPNADEMVKYLLVK